MVAPRNVCAPPGARRSVIGLVGSVGWFPLTIAFPVLCWIKVRVQGCAGPARARAGRGGRWLVGPETRLRQRWRCVRRPTFRTTAAPLHCLAAPLPQVYKPTGLRLAAMRGVCLLMLLVAAGATVGAVYTMVHSFQTVEFFQ